MKANDKKIFVVSIVQSVLKDILSDINKMPADWDGVELRWYIAKKFEERANSAKHFDDRKEKFDSALSLLGL